MYVNMVRIGVRACACLRKPEEDVRCPAFQCLPYSLTEAWLYTEPEFAGFFDRPVILFFPL